VEVICFEATELTVVAAVKINPLHGPFGQGDFVGDLALQRPASDHGVFEPLAKGGFDAMKIAARKILSKGMVPTGTLSGSTVASGDCW